MIKQSLTKLYSRLSKIEPAVPIQIRSNFSHLDSSCIEEFNDLVINNLLVPLSVDYHKTIEGKQDIQTHLDGRLNRFRSHYIPWIDSIQSIRKKSILEIGSGTGSSTQALTEQGGKVTCLDVDEKAIEIAKFRLKKSGQNADFIHANATQLPQLFQKNTFDIVIFFASLEHMTTDERITSLKEAYKVLKPGGALFILEAPNRLWFYDMHTSFLPFYFWLPEDLSIIYAKKSDRKLFRDAIHANTTHTEFSRWGRGVSYHEFEIAGFDNSELSTNHSLFNFLMKNRTGKKLLYKFNMNHKFKKIMRKICPKHIGGPFLEPFLDLAIIKKHE